MIDEIFESRDPEKVLAEYNLKAEVFAEKSYPRDFYILAKQFGLEPEEIEKIIFNLADKTAKQSAAKIDDIITMFLDILLPR